MPELRQRETRLKAELESLNGQLADQGNYLRLTHTLGEFLQRLHTQAQNLDVLERQRIVRLLVKEVVVDDTSITIRHSIPISNRPPGAPQAPIDPRAPIPRKDGPQGSSLLRTWRLQCSSRHCGSTFRTTAPACIETTLGTTSVVRTDSASPDADIRSG